MDNIDLIFHTTAGSANITKDVAEFIPVVTPATSIIVKDKTCNKNALTQLRYP